MRFSQVNELYENEQTLN